MTPQDINPTDDFPGVKCIDMAMRADPDIMKIVLRAQRNPTAEGYWRDVALGLADLVVKLKREIK